MNESALSSAGAGGEDPSGSSTPLTAIPDPAHVEVLAAEVIRRVAAQARDLRAVGKLPDLAQITALADALLARGDRLAADLVRDARLRGMEAEALYHGLVAPAVKKVGQAWTTSEIGLAEMVRASNRVWRILRDLREVFVSITSRVPGQEAVFALCPEECHTIGLTMTADDLRRRGWDIELLFGHDHDGLLGRMDTLSPTTVALAATASDMTLPLARMVVALRAHLPGVWIMVGGGITEQVPDILTLTGADAVANTADEAERLMLAHIADLASRRVNRA